MSQPRIVLFALTGFGNTVLPALCAAGFRPERLVTRVETGPFPYYDEKPLPDLARDLGVPCSFGAEGEAQVAADPPEVLLCATYHRLLPVSLLGKARWAVNLHPSLLPRYRGANPFYWVIRNGETETGVTAHLMSADADAGDILRQEKIPISETETQGSLRRRLADLAARVAVHTLRDIRDGAVTLTPQDEAGARAYGRPGDAERIVDPSWSVADARRAIRALAPFPGLVTEAGTVTGIASSAEATEGRETGLHRLDFADGEVVVRLRHG